ncbi:TIGR03619 family F420-dependent LLM class oxidoreductase [Chloroflexi bacterium TSY]|nr:TIGR03619 family F420-dependent LLM class oxidoreductase [Chloroflexi bacterium TSY]
MNPKIMLILTENWTIVDKQDLRTLVDWAVIAEEAGIYGLMLSDHITLGASAGERGIEPNPRAYAAPGNQDPTTPWPDSLLLFSAIAARTSEIKLFCGAIIAPLRHPVHLAKQLATLDSLSEGRLIVQPTVSWHEDEYEHLGVPFKKRGKLLDEHLEAWQLLWNESPASYAGQHYQFEGVYFEPKPHRSGGPPLWFGGQSMHAPLLRRLVKYGQGFHPFGAPTSEDKRQLRNGLAAAGRNMSEIALIGGIRATFSDNDSPADLDLALTSIPPQIEQGYTVFCVKPDQFISDAHDFSAFCDRLVAGFAEMSL